MAKGYSDHGNCALIRVKDLWVTLCGAVYPGFSEYR